MTGHDTISVSVAFKKKLACEISYSDTPLSRRRCGPPLASPITSMKWTSTAPHHKTFSVPTLIPGQIVTFRSVRKNAFALTRILYLSIDRHEERGTRKHTHALHTLIDHGRRYFCAFFHHASFCTANYWAEVPQQSEVYGVGVRRTLSLQYSHRRCGCRSFSGSIGRGRKF